jgi:hypothetical protein
MWYLNGSPFLCKFLVLDTSGHLVFFTSLYMLNVITFSAKPAANFLQSMFKFDMFVVVLVLVVCIVSLVAWAICKMHYFSASGPLTFWFA